MDKPRIAIVHYACPPVIGGVEAVMENHALLFRDYGYPVKLVVGKGRSFDPEIPVVVIREASSTFHRNVKVQKALHHRHHLKGFETYKDIIKQKLVDALADTDIVFVHNVLTMHFNLAFSAALIEIIQEKILPARFIAWCHDHTFIDPHYTRESIDDYPFNRIKEFLPHVTYVTISPDRQRKFARLYKVKQNRILVVPNGIYFSDFLQLDKRTDEIIQRYQLLDQECIFFAPTRILPRKNLELSIRITAAYKRLFQPKTRLIITGPPDPHNPESLKYYRALHKLAREEHCTRNIIFLYEHFVEKKFRLKVNMLIIRDLYLLSDCLLFPSFMEGFGIPVLEAGLLKRPVVCSNIAPHVTIGGDDVLKINPNGNPENIVRKIMVYLARDITRPLFRRVKKDYTWRRIFSDKIIPLIQQKGRSNAKNNS